MSYDFAIWEADAPLENEEAGEIYISLMQTGASERVRPSERIAILEGKLKARWPDPAPGQEDEWPFASPFDVSHGHLVVCIVPSRLWDVWPILGKLTKELELVMYDPQQAHVFLPKRLSQKRTRIRAKKKRASDNEV